MSQTATPRCPHCQAIIEYSEISSAASATCRQCSENPSTRTLLGTDEAPGTPRDSFRHFELLEILGAGSFGVVWKAHDTHLDRTVALKIARRSGEDSVARDVDLIAREARAAAQLQHAGIVPVYETGVVDDRAYIVTGLVDGQSLKSFFDGRPLPPRQAATICLGLSEALAHAHGAGVIHRDLKPSNVLMDRHGVPHVTDFGLAKRETGDVTVTLRGQSLGTPAYMSPEQAMGESRYVDRRTDIYSLGVILFELLTGERPFRGDAASLLLQILTREPRNPRLLEPSIPVDLETICLKCIQKNPQRRYQTADELAQDLRRYLNGEPIKARPVGFWERSAKWCRRNPAWAVVAASFVLAVLFVITAGFIHQHQLSDTNERLEAALSDADAERHIADAQRIIAERRRIEAESTSRILAERELSARKLLYVDDMRQAQEFWKIGSLEEMNERLERHVPTVGMQDIRGFEWHYLRRQCRRLADRSIQAHAGPVFAIACSPDGRWIASGGEDRALRIQTLAGDVVRKIPSESDSIESIGFSPTGDRVAVGRGNGVVEIYGVSGWTLDVTIPAHSNNVNGVAFGPDSTRLVTGSEDGTVAIWESPAGKLIRRTRPAGSPVESVALSPDGELIAATYSDGMLRVSRLSDGSKVWEFGHRQPARSIRFSRSGLELVSACHDGLIRVFPRDKGVPRLTLKGFAEPVQSVTFAEDDRLIAAADKNGLLRFWDTESGIVRSVVQSPGGRIYSLSASQTDGMVAAGDRSGYLRIWDAGQGARSRILASERPVSDLKLAASGSDCFISFEYEILALALRNGDQHAPAEMPNRSEWTRVPIRWMSHRMSKSVAVSADSRVVAIGDGFNQIALLDAETGTPTRAISIPGSPFFPHCMAFSSNQDELLAGGSPGDLAIIDLRNEPAVPKRIEGVVSDVWQFAFTPDQSRVFLAGNSLVAMCSIADQSVTPLESPPHLVKSIAVSPDGHLAVTGGSDGTLTFWKTAPWKKLRTVKTDSDEIWSLDFSRDGRTVAVGTKNYSLELWHADTNQQLFSIPFYHGALTAVAFSSDGQSLAVGTCSLTSSDSLRGSVELLSGQAMEQGNH
ncbi:MAG: WD40 repeat domain-containing serine/threonine-protein kinase [Planctomycetaceae bacterium]